MTTPKQTSSPPAALPIAYPLDDFYAQAGMKLPPIEALSGEEVPEPYKSLVVHQNDMTPTLEKFHRQRIHIHVLSRQRREDFYFREVVLLTDDGEKPVEFGAIKINLSLFNSTARKHILEERLPLGHILAECAVSHSSRPKAYLRIQSDPFINSILKLQGVHSLYGRRNTLWDPQQHSLAEIVEILPPEGPDTSK
jgi:hypothetical protein